MYYTVEHNVSTDTDDGVSQVNTTMTNITIDGAKPGHVYYIEVTAVNILGPGPPRSTCMHVIISCVCFINPLTPNDACRRHTSFRNHNFTKKY